MRHRITNNLLSFEEALRQLLAHAQVITYRETVDTEKALHRILWIKLQTMLINEYRLTPVDPKARKFLEEEMEKFFFGEGSAVPDEFVKPD